MLYLVRKIGESIIINDTIEVQVVEVKGRSVKLGFDFPPSARVLRKEVHDRIVQENLAAAHSGTDTDLDFAKASDAVQATQPPPTPQDKK